LPRITIRRLGPSKKKATNASSSNVLLGNQSVESEGERYKPMSNNLGTITVRTKTTKTVEGLKVMAGEMEWMLNLLENKEDNIAITITRDSSDLHRINLSLNLKEIKQKN